MRKDWRDGWDKDMDRSCLRCGKMTEGGMWGRNGRMLHRCSKETGCGLMWASAGKLSTVEYVVWNAGAWRWTKTPKGLMAVFGEVA